MKTSEYVHRAMKLLEVMEGDARFSDLTIDDRACVLAIATSAQRDIMNHALQMKATQAAIQAAMDNIIGNSKN